MSPEASEVEGEPREEKASSPKKKRKHRKSKKPKKPRKLDLEDELPEVDAAAQD